MTHHLPEGWAFKPLSCAITRIESGTSVNAEDRQRREGELGVLKLSCLHSGLLDIRHHKAVLGSEESRVSGHVRGETIIISRKNTAELVGASAYSPDDIPGLYLSDLLWQLHIDKAQANPKWLAYLLRSEDARNRISSCASGTSGSMKGITKSTVAALEFFFPPLPEQRRIVEILDEADAAVRTMEALIAAKLRHKRAWAERLLTGRTRFPEFAGEAWQEFPIGTLLREVERPVTWDDEDEYDLVSVRRRSEGLFHRGRVKGERIKTKNLKQIGTGDFLISKMQVVHGAWGLVTPEFHNHHVSDSYITLIPKLGVAIDMRFFAMLSQLPQIYRLALVSSHGVHIEKMTFNLELLFRERVSIPPTSAEQGRIADVLGLMDEEIALRRRQLLASKAQKQGLMQKLLTGEVRVKEFAP